VRLNDEPVTASFDFDEAVQSYCVEEIEFHGVSIDRKNANVRFPPITDIARIGGPMTACGTVWGMAKPSTVWGWCGFAIAVPSSSPG